MIGSYETSKTLGTGAFGTVVLAKKKHSDKLYAIKSISKKNILRSQMSSQVKKEISIMKSLEHPNIVQIYEVLSSAEYLYIVMDYVSGGELYTKITRGGKLGNNECRKYVRQLCSALEYCHSRNVCHRDIKPQNILLDKNDNVLLADFGFASIMEVEELQKGVSDTTPTDDNLANSEEFSSTEDTDTNRTMEGTSRIMKNMSTVCGTMSYMAPEIFNREKYMGDKADIWSLGVVIYVLLVGFMPFKETDTLKSKFTTPNYVTKDAHNFISNMLVIEALKRYSARRLLLHRWISELEDISEGEDSAKEEISDSDENSEEGSQDGIDSDFTSVITKQHSDILEILFREMKEDGWNVRMINGALRASKMSLTGIVVVSIEVVGNTLEVRNANLSRDANVEVMKDLSVLIKKVT